MKLAHSRAPSVSRRLRRRRLLFGLLAAAWPPLRPGRLIGHQSPERLKAESVQPFESVRDHPWAPTEITGRLPAGGERAAAPAGGVASSNCRFASAVFETPAASSPDRWVDARPDPARIAESLFAAGTFLAGSVVSELSRRWPWHPEFPPPGPEPAWPPWRGRLDGRRVLIVTGGQWHDYGFFGSPDRIGERLRELFDGSDAQVRLTSDPKELQTLRSEDIVVLHQNREIPSSLEQALETFVASGGRALALHSTLAIHPGRANRLAGLLGGYSTGHDLFPSLRPFRVEVSSPGHPLSYRLRGGYTVMDERYRVVTAADSRVVLTHRFEDGHEGPMAWYREVGKGRVVSLANGHDIAALRHPDVAQFLLNAVAWLALR